MEKRKTVKYCIVPCCSNNCIKNSNKLFIRVPQTLELKKKWYKAINPTKTMRNTFVHVCEDHFNLENDSENWIQYKLIGKRLEIKKDVVPHKNLIVNLADTSLSQISSEARKQKERNLRALKSASFKGFEEVHDTASGKFRITKVEQDTWKITTDVAVQVTFTKQSLDKAIQADVKKTRTIGTQVYFKSNIIPRRIPSI